MGARGPFTVSALFGASLLAACTTADTSLRNVADAGSGTGPVVTGSMCAPGQFALAGRMPPPPEAVSTPLVSPAGDWAITDISADCGCRLKLTETALGRRGVTPSGCRHPGLAGAARYGLSQTDQGYELMLMAPDNRQVIVRLVRVSDAYYLGRLNGRPVVMWREPS